MSLSELEEKIETFIDCDVNNIERFYYYQEATNYVIDNEEIFFDLYDTLPDRIKIVVDSFQNSKFGSRSFDYFLESDLPWSYFLLFSGYDSKFNNEDLLIKNYCQEKFEGLTDITQYENLLRIFFKNFNSYDRLPDEFVDHYQNVIDKTHQLFWTLVAQKDIELLKRYDHKYTLEIHYEPHYLTEAHKNLSPIDILKSMVLPYTDFYDYNTDGEFCYQSIEITNENILDIMWEFMQKGQYGPIHIINYFDSMTMSECVCWFARLRSIFSDDQILMSAHRTSSYVFLEYVKEMINIDDIETSIKNDNLINFSEAFIKTIIKIKPEILDSLISNALRNNIKYLMILIPDITCQNVIKYFEEHPELLEK